MERRSEGDLDVPHIFLLHGFGGSLDQFTETARSLSRDGRFVVHAMDSLGFGHSEKPPLSYNQYLWRDQFVHFVETTLVEIAVSAGLGNHISRYS